MTPLERLREALRDVYGWHQQHIIIDGPRRGETLNYCRLCADTAYWPCPAIRLAEAAEDVVKAVFAGHGLGPPTPEEAGTNPPHPQAD